MTRIGLVGVGDISRIYLDNMTSLFRELRVVAVCDLIRERAEKARVKYGIPKLYDTMDQLFADPEVDLVLNLTRPYQHYGVSKAALLGGKPVYSEKPLAASLEEGRELVELAQERGLALGGAPDTFLGAGIQTCRYLLDSGVIGDPVGFEARMLCRGHESWHPDPEFYYKYGGGPMLDMGPYYITALVNLLGGVHSVMGQAVTTFPSRTCTCKEHFGEQVTVDVPTHIAGVLRFDSGIVGTVTTSFDVVYPKSDMLEIYGTQGTLFVPDPNCFGGPVRYMRRGDAKVYDAPLMFPYAENSRALGLADLAKSLETGRPGRTTWKQTLHVLEIMESFRQSGEQGREIVLRSKYTREAPMTHTELPGILD